MTAFDDLVRPLLTDPPRPAPALPTLHARVAQRRRRRAATLVISSLLVVLVVASAAVALPRDRGADVLAGPAGTDAPATSGPTAPGTGPVDTVPEIAPSTVQLTIAPERAKAADARELTVTSVDGTAYQTCLSLELRRWGGSSWQSYGWVHLQEGLGTFEVLAQPYPATCSTPVPLPMRTAIPFRFHWANSTPGAPDLVDQNVKMLPLDPGWYELSDGPARGRFQVTTASADPGAPTEVAGPTVTVAGPAAPDAIVVDLHPVRASDLPEPLNGAGPYREVVAERLPDHAIAIDDDTVSLSWVDDCQAPASSVAARATADEVELHLSVLRLELADCQGPTERYVVTFDLPFAIGGRPIVARASGSTDSVAIAPKPAGSQVAPTEPIGDGSVVAASVVTTFTVLDDQNRPGTGRLYAAGLSCHEGAHFGTYEVDGTVVAQLHQVSRPWEAPGCPSATARPDDLPATLWPGTVPGVGEPAGR